MCDQEILGETITSIQMGGVLFGAVLTGQLADLFGRRNILFIEHAILVIMWFCSAFAGSWMVYAGLRFIIGGLIGGTVYNTLFYQILTHAPIRAHVCRQLPEKKE